MKSFINIFNRKYAFYKWVRLLCGICGLVWIVACGRPSYLRTITEVKRIASEEPRLAIPVLIEAIEQGNRDVAYSSLATLGYFYEKLIPLLFNEEAGVLGEADVVMIEEFLVERYDASKSDFNHKNIILRSLSYGLYQRQVADDFFKRILDSTVADASNIPEVERAELLGYGFTLLVIAWERELLDYEESGEPDKATSFMSFKTTFLKYCEQGLSDPSNYVFEKSLACVMNFVNHTGEAARVGEEVSVALSKELKRAEEASKPMRIFVLKRALERLSLGTFSEG